jgi:hypothetical protein
VDRTIWNPQAPREHRERIDLTLRRGSSNVMIYRDDPRLSQTADTPWGSLSRSHQPTINFFSKRGTLYFDICNTWKLIGTHTCSTPWRMAQRPKSKVRGGRRQFNCNITASYLPDDKMLTSTKAQEPTSPPPDTGNIERAVSRQQTQVINGEK